MAITRYDNICSTKRTMRMFFFHLCVSYSLVDGPQCKITRSQKHTRRNFNYEKHQSSRAVRRAIDNVPVSLNIRIVWKAFRINSSSCELRPMLPQFIKSAFDQRWPMRWVYELCTRNLESVQKQFSNLCCTEFEAKSAGVLWIRRYFVHMNSSRMSMNAPKCPITQMLDSIQMPTLCIFIMVCPRIHVGTY